MDFSEAVKDPKSDEHAALLKHVRKLVGLSRKEMSKNYDKWDMHDATFRSEKKVDKEDRNAMNKGQPAKMIVPLTFSQIMTFVAFGVMTTTQNKRFYELEPTGSEDNPLKESMELILERDTRRNTWTTFLVQFFLDIGRFCLGAAEVCYTESYRKMRVPQERVQPGAFGLDETVTESPWIDIPVFVGNKVHSISPYRIFPDTRLPLTRYQEGEFCASEEFWSMSSLRADSGHLFNLDKIPKMDQKARDDRMKNTRGDFSAFEIRENPNSGGDRGNDYDADNCCKTGTVLVTKIVLDIIPKDFEVDNKSKSKMGEEDFPVRYIVWVANDKTIVRFEEAYYLHCQFPYVLAQFLPDQHRTVNEGLADVCDQITTLITWLINAHVTSVRSTIESKFVVDPSIIDMASLESRSPYIKTKKTGQGQDVKRSLQQLETRDVTGAFMADAQGLTELLEKITAFSGNMMGQYSAGRRSATEARVVTQGASARAKTTLGGIWDSAFEPLARQLISNNRQEMTFETFARIVGKGPFEISDVTMLPMEVDELYSLFHADPITIASAEDFFVFDGTLPSEKAFLAQSLQELLMTFMTNPEIMAVMGYGPKEIKTLIDNIFTLRGVTNSQLPSPSVPTQQPMMPPNAVPMAGAGAPPAVPSYGA